MRNALGNPADLKQEIDLTSNPSAYYIGWANPGTPTSSSIWLIKKISLVSGSPSEITWTKGYVGTWDNRLTETYA